MWIDGDASARERIGRELAAGPHNVSVVWDGDRAGTALAWLARGAAVDLAIVELGLRDIAGPALVRAITECRPGLLVLVLTTEDDEATVHAIFRAGAAGYLVKPVSPTVLAEAVVSAMDGEAPMSPCIARILLNSWKSRASDGDDVGDVSLTPREHDVLALLARGLTYAAVSAELGIGLGTVQGYVKSLYGKLNVNSRAEARDRARQLRIGGWGRMPRKRTSAPPSPSAGRPCERPPSR